jgi:hypothetical protein
MSVLLLFLDGVGLGDDDLQTNPFARAEMPALTTLLGGRRLLRTTEALETERAQFIPTDATLGVPGRPQSATGQTAILTGLNAPTLLGQHWGPKPDARLRPLLERDTLFHRVVAAECKAALLNAYPARYFAALDSGRRLLSAVPLAATSAGLRLFTADDLAAGRALAADFTAVGWRDHLGYHDAPVLTPYRAGQRLAQLARAYAFSFFEHWPTDVLGHRATIDEAVPALEQFDAVLGGLLDAWDNARDLLVITSDHGNLEDLSHRHHTLNPVPTILVGRRTTVQHPPPTVPFDLTHIAPLIAAALALSVDHL